MTPSSVLRLSDMSKGEARQLLRQRTTEQALCDDETAVDELLEALTCLPLAIVQAAAFMSTNDVTVSDYLALFRGIEAQAELFSEGFADPSRHDDLDSTIAKTWHISFDQIRKQDPLAAEYLSFMACIDRVNIPKSLLPPGASMIQQTKALGTLTGYAFDSWSNEQQIQCELDMTLPGYGEDNFEDRSGFGDESRFGGGFMKIVLALLFAAFKTPSWVLVSSIPQYQGLWLTIECSA